MNTSNNEEKTGFLKKDQNNPPPKKHRLLDSNLNVYKCVYKVHYEPVNITMQADSSKKEEEKADQNLHLL